MTLTELALMNADVFHRQFPNWPSVSRPVPGPSNPAFTAADERTDDEPAYIGGMSEREERLSSRDDD